MELNLTVQLSLAFLVAALGWMATHEMSMRRDAANDKRRQRTTHLLEVYVRLESAAYVVDAAFARGEVEKAIAQVQLLGSPRQVELAQSFARAMQLGSSASLDDLLQDLRADLRKELNMDQVPWPIIFLRMGPAQHGPSGSPRRVS